MALSILLLLRWVILIITLFIAPLTATLSPQPYRTRIGVILDLFGGFRVLGVVSLTVEGVLKHQSRPTTTSIVVLLLLEDAVRAVQVCLCCCTSTDNRYSVSEGSKTMLAMMLHLMLLLLLPAAGLPILKP